MAKFKKKIVTPAVHDVGRLDGTTEKDAITKDRIKSWADNTNKLIELGFEVPAPYTHQDKNKRFAFPVIKAGEDETLSDAYSGTTEYIPPAWDVANQNTGFWDKFEVDADGALVGEADIVGEVNDVNTPAGKLGKTIRQTSVLVMPPRTVRGKDGQDHQIGEHLAHVAVCLHGREPGQSNFEPMTSVPTALAMSFTLAMDDITGTGLGPDPSKPKDEELYTAISLLRSALGVALPEDTTRENFLSSLKLVLTQKLADKQENEQEQGVNTRPPDGQVKSPTMAMSQTTQTPAPSDKIEALLMSSFVKSKRKELEDRAKKLVSTGRTSKEFADKNIFPAISALAMSSADLLSTGEFSKTATELLIEGLEAATPLTGPSQIDQGGGFGYVPEEGMTQQIPADVITGNGVADLSDKAMDEMLDAFNV